MFRLNRNERSHWSGNGVHVESELVFMIGRNMQQYCSGLNQTLYERYGVQYSMTDGYDCYQNAPAERVNGILKGELL